MKFKVGDKVRIKRDLASREKYGPITFLDGYMSEQRGKEAVIERADSDGTYRFKGFMCWWSEEMLEPAEPADNYLCINGRKIALTDEQMQQLAPEKPTPEKKSPFARVDCNSNYFSIYPGGQVIESKEDSIGMAEERFNSANYCTDEALMKQRALHETLSRLLWRFAMENGGEPAIDQPNATIYIEDGEFQISPNWEDGFSADLLSQRFASKAVARRAIDEIVKPFLAAHPDFVW